MTTDHSTLWSEALDRGLPRDGALLVVEVSAQLLHLVENGEVACRYVVSTSKHGTGNVLDSFKTPTGWHEVVERYGDDEPPGRVFFEREPTDECLPPEAWSSDDARDLILTRILRLGGLEEGVNRGGAVDTYERYVYLHGANHEHQLGTPVSHGCIHVGNRKLVELYDRIRDRPVWCWIGRSLVTEDPGDQER